MKQMNHWLRHLHNQMAQKGLTDKANKPEERPCKNGHPIEYEWKDQGAVSFWTLQPCEICQSDAEKDRLRTALERRLESTRVPAMLRWARPDCLAVDERNQHMVQALAEWRPPDWMVVFGPVGTGKTTWLTALFNSLVEQGADWTGGIWTTEAELFESCDIAHAAEGYTGRQKALRRFIGCPILLLDDAGAGRAKLTEWQLSSMRHLFDVRHSNGLPTFITTNLEGPAKFAAKYGDHVISRVLQASRRFLYLGGSDRRVHEA